MSKKSRNLIALFVIFVLCITIQSFDVKAEDASVVIGLSASSVSMGDSVSVTVTVSGDSVSQYTIYVTYDSSVLQFQSASGAAQGNGSGGTITLCGGSGSTTLSFTAIANGTSYISTSGTEVYDINYNQLTISHAGASVTVATEETTEAPTTESPTTEESTTSSPATESPSTTETPATTQEERSSNCNLASLQVSPGTLEPEFSYDVTSYTVNLEEDITEIVISAQAEDSGASTNVTGADDLKPGANTVKVIVTAENGAVKIYTIKVVVGEEIEVANVDIDGKNYTFTTEVVGLNVPEGYSSTTISYKDWEVLAFQSPNKKIVLVCLQDGESKNSWFIYKEETDEFLPYNEFSPNHNRYIILNVPDGVSIPATFQETEVTINGKKLKAYRTSDITDENIYILYAMNIDAEEGFYMYDSSEGTFLRYSGFSQSEVDSTATSTDSTGDLPNATEGEDIGISKTILLYIIIGVAVLAIILLGVLIGVAIKSKKYKNELEDAEGMIEQLVNVTGGKVNHEALEALPEVEEKDKKKKKAENDKVEEKTSKKEKKRKDKQEEKEVVAEDKKEIEDNQDKTEDVDISGPIETIKLQEQDPSDDDTSKIDVQVISEIVDLDKEEAEKKTHGEAYDEFKKQSDAIKFKLQENYDVDKDSAFSDDSQS